MIDSRALIESGAELEPNVSVGAFSVIGSGVQIGAGTWIGPHVVIEGPTRIGRDNRIFQFSSIGAAPQDKKYSGEKTLLEIGDRNTIREFCTINRGTAQDRGATTLGNDNWIMAYVHVAHDCVLGDDIILANCATLAGHVVIENHAILGGFVKVHQFCRIGTHSFCGMNVDLTRDVAPYMMVSGNPPAPHGINVEGLKRRGFRPEQIQGLRRAYRILYRSGLRLEEAIAELEKLAADDALIRTLVDFLQDSKRSIVR